MHPKTPLLMLLALLIQLCAGPLLAQQELKFAIMLTRHGVLSATWSPEQLNEYSAEPWPGWGVPPGQTAASRSREATIVQSYLTGVVV